MLRCNVYDEIYNELEEKIWLVKFCLLLQCHMAPQKFYNITSNLKLLRKQLIYDRYIVSTSIN